MRFRFGDFTFDGGRRRLLKGSDPVRLSSRAVELLALLLARRRSAVSKEEIQDALWPDSLVTETTVATLVSEVRAALGDPARSPRLVRTVFGFGYVFDGEVEELPLPEGEGPPRRHVLAWGSRELPLHEGENLLGRDPDAGVPVVHPSVSRGHARITVEGDLVTVEDLASKNGTFVRGERLDGPVVVRTGDEVGFGKVVLRYLDLRAGTVGETETAR